MVPDAKHGARLAPWFTVIMKRYIIFVLGVSISGFLIFWGLNLKDFQEVLRNAVIVCLSCIGIAN